MINGKWPKATLANGAKKIQRIHTQTHTHTRPNWNHNSIFIHRIGIQVSLAVEHIYTYETRLALFDVTVVVFIRQLPANDSDYRVISRFKLKINQQKKINFDLTIFKDFCGVRETCFAAEIWCGHVVLSSSTGHCPAVRTWCTHIRDFYSIKRRRREEKKRQSEHARITHFSYTYEMCRSTHTYTHIVCGGDRERQINRFWHYSMKNKERQISK